MKASEVVKRYQQGERDFRGVNLRGQSFKGQNLSGADFSEADIRGTNFKGAILRRVKFRGAKAGLQKRWAITLVFVSLVISFLSGFLFALVGYQVSLIFNSSSLGNQFAGWTSLIMLIIFYIFMFRKGLGAALGAFAFAVVVFVLPLVKLNRQIRELPTLVFALLPKTEGVRTKRNKLNKILMMN